VHSADYMEKLSIFFQQCNPTSRQHTCREKNREEQDGGHLTCRNERCRSRSREEEETWQHQVVEVAGSRRSGRWSPAAAARHGRRQQRSRRHPAARAPRLASHAPPRDSAGPRPSRRPRPLPSFTVESPSSLTPATRRTGCSGRPDGSDPFSGAYSRSPGGGNRGVVTAGGMLDQGEEESRVGNRGVVTSGCMLVSGEQRRRRRNEAEKGSMRPCLGKVQK
jgi:hypothetical protein